MHRLISGIRDFHENIFPSRRAQFEELANGQRPSTLFITCSDSRIIPHMLTQTEPGELFVLRNAGNIVPPATAELGGEAATIEYAVQALQVEDIIICGHSHCGAVAALLRPQVLEGLPTVEKWLGYAEKVRRDIENENLAADGDDDLLTTAVKANVLAQLHHLRTYPAVAEAEARGALRLHGCFYRLETGEVSVFSASDHRYVAISEYLADATVA